MYHIEQLQAVFYILGIVMLLYAFLRYIRDIVPYRVRRAFRRKIIVRDGMDGPEEYADRDFQWVDKITHFKDTDMESLLSQIDHKFLNRPGIIIVNIQFLDTTHTSYDDKDHFYAVIQYHEKEPYDAE